MKSSESITEIAQALCKLQTEIQDAPKDAQAHNYKYADLGTILELVRPVMAANGLSVAQMPCGDGTAVGITTRLMHNSGEWLESTIMMGVTDSRGMSAAQAAGSVLTYCRRYSLAAALGITQVDNDAHADVAKNKVVKESKPATEEQRLLIKDYDAEKQLPERHASWLEKNWDTMTSDQAASIIEDCKK